MATIWDADVLICAASQIVEARDAGLKTSRLMVATPYEILTFVGRGTSARDYDRLKAAFDRLQSTTVGTSIRQPTKRRRHRFSWINEWKEAADVHGRPRGLELILPDDLREIVRRQTLPGYQLVITRDGKGAERLTFAPTSIDPIAQRLRKRRRASGTGGNL